MEYTEEEGLKILLEFQLFLKKYGKYYKEIPGAYEYIKQQFFVDISYGKPNDIIRSIIEELGLNRFLENDYYKNFIEYMKSETGIDKNLLEVGCGILPSLANKISKEQTCGSVTAMDPKVIEAYEGNIGIIKKEFTLDTDVSNYDLIYGFYPCQATTTMIKSSFKNDKDLFLEMCGCTHDVPREFASSQKIANKYHLYLRYLDYILEQLSSTDRTYEIIRHQGLDYQVVRTYKPKNFY